MTQQMSPRADIFFNFTLVCSQKIFFQSLRGITPSKFIVSEPYTKGWKDEKGQHNMPRPIYDGSILKFTIYCIPRLFVEWWKSWSFFENPHIKCDGWRDWLEIKWRDWMERQRMKDERHIVNTSCPGHIPYMAGNKNQIKLWCLQYIFYK